MLRYKECKTLAPSTIAPVINDNIKRNPNLNPNPKLGKSVGLCKTSKRKDQLYISFLVSVWRIICENFNLNRLILAEK